MLANAPIDDLALISPVNDDPNRARCGNGSLNKQIEKYARNSIQSKSLVSHMWGFVERFPLALFVFTHDVAGQHSVAIQKCVYVCVYI